MSTEPRRIGEKARSDPRLVFTSLYHHVCDMEHLRACFGALPADRAVGIDGITKEQYGEHLDENLRKLSERLRNMGYRPRAKRRTYIPKPGSAKGRPLAISCFEDKLVELALKRVLEPIYEVQFEDSSYGYRPGRSQHQCLDDLGRTLQQRRVNHVVEADIRSFFNTVDHDWMLTFLRHRIGDPRIIRLIGRLLKGGILEDGLVQASEEGTPQGSILIIAAVQHLSALRAGPLVQPPGAATEQRRGLLLPLRRRLCRRLPAPAGRSTIPRGPRRAIAAI